MPESGFIEIDGFHLKYCIEGTGPTALVVGNAVYYSRSFSKELRESLRLVFVDWRGFAECKNSEPTSSITFDTLLEDIEKIRIKLHIEKCIIIGHSAHALLALEYAKKYPKNVSHVVMIGAVPNLSPECAVMAARNWEESVCPERKAALAEKIRQFPDEELAKLPPSERFVKWNARRNPLAWFDFHFDSSRLWKGIIPNTSLLDFFYGVALRELDISRGLERFDRPVLLALGRFDYAIAPANSWDPFRPKFQDLTVRSFERSAHSPHYEEPDLFNKELLNWLKDHG